MTDLDTTKFQDGHDYAKRNVETVENAEKMMGGSKLFKAESASDHVGGLVESLKEAGASDIEAGVSEILKSTMSEPHPSLEEVQMAVSDQQRVTSFPDVVRSINQSLLVAAEREISTLDDRIENLKARHEQEMKALTDKKGEYLSARNNVADIIQSVGQ